MSLGADGKVRFASHLHGEYVKSKGDWEIKVRDPNKKSSRNRVLLEIEGPRYSQGTSFYVMEDSEGLTLWNSLGDAYDGQYLQYKRADNADR